MPFTDTGNWYAVADDVLAGRRGALFLDRDGVVVHERHFLRDPEAIELITGAATAIARFRKLSFAIVLVTNQSGIGRGLFGWDEFFAVQARLDALLAEQMARIDMVLACPHHPTDGVGPFRRSDSWRKPEPGMILFAADTLAVDLGRSTLVGDRLSDIEAGAAAGIGRLIHVHTGHGATERDLVAASPSAANVEMLPSLSSLDPVPMVE